MLNIFYFSILLFLPVLPVPHTNGGTSKDAVTAAPHSRSDFPPLSERSRDPALHRPFQERNTPRTGKSPAGVPSPPVPFSTVTGFPQIMGKRRIQPFPLLSQPPQLPVCFLQFRPHILKSTADLSQFILRQHRKGKIQIMIPDPFRPLPQ